MNDDLDLLRRYADAGDEDAFAELVRRHVDFVYAVAIRRTGGNPHSAADVAQTVFTALAQNARRLGPATVVPAWLHTATRNAAIKLMISEQRRRHRDARVLLDEGAPALDSATPDWERLRPLIDSAVDELPEADRAPLILRFFERRAYAEIARALRLSEDAARMRTSRALEKLRVALTRRGIASTTAAIAAAVSTQPLVAAPAGLAAAVATHSLATASAGATIAALGTFMSTKALTTVVLSATVAFLLGGYLGARRPAETTTASALTSAKLSSTASASVDTELRTQNQLLQAERAALRSEVIG